MGPGLKEYIDLFFSFNNPVFYAIFIIIILSVFIYIFVKHAIIPLQKSHQLEKKELELKNAQLMSLFAELDPDPVLRINLTGAIIFSNDAAKQLDPKGILNGKDIKDILPQIKFNIMNYISADRSRSFSHSLNGRYYSVLFRGISSLEIGQIYFHDFTDKKNYERKLLRYNKRLRELSNNLQDKLEEERQRIARELHDSIGQNLLLMKLDFQNFESSQSNSNGGRENYDAIIESLERTIAEFKIILYDLKPKILEEMGLGPALKSLCHKISAEANIKGSINISGLEERLDYKLELSLYRIIQEALNNIVKHSAANEFNIQLINNNNLVRLMVSDDGKGFGTKSSKEKMGLGLVNMRERIENLNGSLKIDSSLENGTVLIFEIPKEN